MRSVVLMTNHIFLILYIAYFVDNIIFMCYYLIMKYPAYTGTVLSLHFCTDKADY